MHLFDNGWNALRDQIFANQKKLGVIPQDAKLTPWPDELVRRWDSSTAEERKLFIRQAEVYAAYLVYTDHEIGRVIQAVEDMGKLDNTLIIYISGDNGHSAEGSPNGTPNEVLQFNGVELPVAEQMKCMMSGAQTRPFLITLFHGPGRSIRPSNGSSRSLPISVALARAWQSRCRRSSRTRGASAGSFTT